MKRECGPGVEERIAAARKAKKAAKKGARDYYFQQVNAARKAWTAQAEAICQTLRAAGVDGDEARRRASYPYLTGEEYQAMLRRYDAASRDSPP